MKIIKKALLTSLTASALLSGASQAAMVEVEVSNLFNTGGLALTPVWVGFHDGTFDSFDVGASSSSSLQALAENGDVSGIMADFTASNTNGEQGAILAPDGFAGAPVFEPGESATSGIFEINATDSGYFSFLSMLIPTNDAFIGNEIGTAYSLFDMNNEFVGLDILVLGSDVWDSGTELNRGYGAPFLAGADAEERQDENGVVSQHAGLTVLAGGLSIFGGNTPAGYSIDQAAADFTAQGFEVARITVNQVQVPVPASAGLFAIGMVALAGFKRRKTSVKVA